MNTTRFSRPLAFLALVTCLPIQVAKSAEQDSLQSDGIDRVYVWKADRAHSSIVFETGHWGIVDIVGWFEDYEIHVRHRELDFSDAAIEVRVRPASVRMPNPGMAANLRNLFFLVELHPEVHFASKRIEPTDVANEFNLVGTLTMKDVRREITVAMRFNGYGTPPQGAPGFKVRGTLNRLDFGVGGMEHMMGTGHPLIDAEVEITCNIRLEFVRTEFVGQ